jgi:hypothetical protein
VTGGGAHSLLSNTTTHTPNILNRTLYFRISFLIPSWFTSRISQLLKPQLRLAANTFEIGDDYSNNSVNLDRLCHTQCLNEFINFVFPCSILSDPAACILRAILSPYNIFIDEFNTAILQNVPGESHCYVSNDSIEAEANSNEGVFSDPSS